MWGYVVAAVLGAGAGALATYIAMLSDRGKALIGFTALAVVSLVLSREFGIQPSPLVALLILSTGLAVYAVLGRAAEANRLP